MDNNEYNAMHLFDAAKQENNEGLVEWCKGQTTLQIVYAVALVSCRLDELPRSICDTLFRPADRVTDFVGAYEQQEAETWADATTWSRRFLRQGHGGKTTDQPIQVVQDLTVEINDWTAFRVLGLVAALCESEENRKDILSHLRWLDDHPEAFSTI